MTSAAPFVPWSSDLLMYQGTESRLERQPKEPDQRPGGVRGGESFDLRGPGSLDRAALDSRREEARGRVIEHAEHAVPESKPCVDARVPDPQV